MSGGYFEYNQRILLDIIEKLEEDLKENFIDEKEKFDGLSDATPSQREHFILHIQKLVEDLKKYYNILDELDLYLCADTGIEDFLKAYKNNE